MQFYVFHRDSMRDAYDQDPPAVDRIAFTHVATLETDETDGVLEYIYRAMNVVDGDEIPVRLKKRSLSVGDVIQDEMGRAAVCRSAGWTQCVTSGLRVDPNAPTFRI